MLRMTNPTGLAAAGGELVARASGGDTGAFEALYREHVCRVYGLCLRMTGHPQSAEDLTQDTFVNAWRSLPGYEGRSSFSTWLHRIAVNAVLARRRSPQGRNEVSMTNDSGEQMDFEADKAMRLHVGRTVRRMRDVAGVPEAVAAGRVSVVGAVYDLDTGRVDLL